MNEPAPRRETLFEDCEVGRLTAVNDDRLARLKVLIVDDDPVDREVFRHYLDGDHPGSFLYAEAASGEAGLRQLREFTPDCVLLDFQLPDMDGLNMIRLLHEDRDFLPCAVVMLTGIGSEEIAVEAMKLGVMDYMAKGPASSKSLARTVASAVQRFRLQQENTQQRLALEQRNLELEVIRQELFEEKERYRILTEAIPQLVWTADAGGRVLYGNQRLWDFTGKANARAWDLESLVHADDKTLLKARWLEGVASGGAFETELRLWRAQDQTWRWHLMRAVRMRPDEGPVHWFGTFTDIEDQKRAEEALRQREKLDSVGLLAGGIAHDFNNLLVGIMGGASFALDSLDREHPAYPMLEIVMSSSDRAARLTQQLLEYAGKIQVLLEAADIERVLWTACEAARDSIPRNIRLHFEPAKDIPIIETNAGYLQQIVLHLVTNAAEAIGTQTGVITVKSATEVIPEGKPQSNALGYQLPAGSYVLIEVSDSGPGMNDHLKTHIFDPFFTTKFTGRGLGLAAVQGIVRALGGAIRVNSATGRGSTFQVLLPLREPSANVRDGSGNGLEAGGAAG